MTNELHEAIGRHEAQIETLHNDMSEVKADVKAIRQLLDQAKGGWRTLIIVAGIAGATGAFLSKVAPFFNWTPK